MNAPGNPPIKKTMKKRKLTHEQFVEALHIYRERNCADCGWLTAALHWWCTNQKAIDARGTTFPGICHCPWWKPDRDYIRKQLRELPIQSKNH